MLYRAVGGALAVGWHALADSWHALMGDWRCFRGQLAGLYRAVGSALAGGWQAVFCGSLSGFRRIYLLAEDRFDFKALRGYAFCKNI